jgi:CheY-like chemotaxis protein
MFEARALSLTVDVPADLPPILCDSTRIRQVILNLLSNAGRFTDEGGVHISAYPSNDDVVVSVADTGPGIPPEEQDMIFEPFWQLEAARRNRRGGSGLGLSISRQFVEMHEGRMWLESQPGHGTTFYFSLPLDLHQSLGRPLDETDARRWFNPYAPYETRSRRSKAPVPDVVPRIILLERGGTMEHLFSRYAEGVEVLPVQDVGSAASELARSPARALVVGATSPDLSDISLEDINRLPHGTPAIVCWMPGQAHAARELGVVSYVVKPVNRQTLLETVYRAVPSPDSVLLVDDEPQILQLFARVLHSDRPGIEVLRATNGQQALRLMRDRHPSLVVLDLIMPEIDGFRVLQAKREDPALRHIPVVIVSSRDAVVGNSLMAVTRSGGLTVQELLDCIQAVSDVLAPRLERRELSGSRVA